MIFFPPMERDDVFADDPNDRSPLALDPETLLNDQFRVGRVLGVGGFGVTYLAFDEVLEIVVAVKEYLPNDIAVRKSDGDTVQPYTSTGDNQDFEFGLKRFLQEARTLAKFENHPNIVRVRTFFEANGTGYLVMNFYEGCTLAEYLEARNGFLPEQEALLVMEQVTEGLSAVHGQNVLHRDIDPNNVYLANNGTVVLLDFGAARTAVGERTQSMSVVLKRGYAPHEQYHSHGDQGPWTDVYACSATLYRSLTGYKPPEAAARILDDDLVAPKELVPSLSDATNEAILEGLAVRPDDRPQTMDDFARRLPAPPSETEPKWISDVSTVETSTAPADTSGELEITASHPCRLYVDGNEVAALTPHEPHAIGVETGSHRLRAVRTDQAESGSATVTASGSSIEEDESAPRLTLDTLMWQSVVSVSPGTPLTVTVDFEGSSTAATETSPAEGADTEGTGVADAVAPDAAPILPEEEIGTPEPAGDEEAVAPAETAAGTDDADAERAAADRLLHVVADGTTAVQAHLPSEQGVKAVGRTVVVAGRELGTAVQDWGAAAWKGGTDLVQSLPSDQLYAYGSAVLAGLVLLLGLGWWMAADEPTAVDAWSSLPIVTTTTEAVFDVRTHHQGAGNVRLAGMGAVPDSVATITAVDSVRFRITPAKGFAGTVRVPYEVVAGQDSVQAAVRLQVPFADDGRRITDTIERPQVVRADSLGGDDAIDVVVAALGGKSVTWNESIRARKSGFGASTPIETGVDGVVALTTADLSGNHRPDVVAASLKDDLVAWYENQSDSTFGKRRPIDAGAEGAGAVATADVDGDGASDVVAGTVLAETVVWYHNEGGGTFDDGTVFIEDLGGLETLHVADLNENGRPEVLAVSYQEPVIHRYEPTGSTADSLQMVKQAPIGETLDEPIAVHTADVVGDARKDLLVGTVGPNSLLLFENRTGQDDDQALGPKQILASDLQTIESIDTGDLNNDGTLDIVAAAFDSDAVAWVQNKGNGTFEAPESVATAVPDVISVEVADVDHNGRPDVVVASQAENAVDWYKNHLSDDEASKGRPQ